MDLLLRENVFIKKSPLYEKHSTGAYTEAKANSKKLFIEKKKKLSFEAKVQDDNRWRRCQTTKPPWWYMVHAL